MLNFQALSRIHFFFVFLKILTRLWFEESVDNNYYRMNLVVLQMLPVLEAVPARRDLDQAETLLLSKIKSCLRAQESKKRLAHLVSL